MKKKIHKFALKLIDYQTINIRADSEFLTAQFQGDILCLWATVNISTPIVEKTIIIVGTGFTLDDFQHMEYIATVQDRSPNGNFVWHVFAA